MFEPGQPALRPPRRFHPPPSAPEVSGLFRLSRLSHCRRSVRSVLRQGLGASTFLRPLAPRALPRFSATTDALTPAGRFFGPCGQERRSGPSGSPCLWRPHVPPFRPHPPGRPSPGISFRSRFLSARDCPPVDPAVLRWQRETLPQGSWPGLRTGLAGSPVGLAESGSRCVRVARSRCYGPVVHLRQLSTPCHHDAVAFGYRRVNVPPDGDFHPAVCSPSHAYESRL